MQSELILFVCFVCLVLFVYLFIITWLLLSVRVCVRACVRACVCVWVFQTPTLLGFHEIRHTHKKVAQ